MPTLLLHICCGPCAAAVIDRLRCGYDVTGCFHNPNIQPEEEYIRRLEAARTVAAHFGIPLVELPYTPEAFDGAVQGLENEPENGARCPVCYRMRFDGVARYAAGHGFPFMASTLTTGPRKPAAIIDPIGREAAEAAGIAFVEGDWKKRNGFGRSLELSRELELYRQHYCGCLFSREREMPGRGGEPGKG
jgi:predicted adenine nucleotide alpha hydrolase (AANH) superfamily ATPase